MSIVIANDPNGSRTERSTRDALAELGARVVVILNQYGARRQELDKPGHPKDPKSHPAYSEVLEAARNLGLLDTEAARG